MGDEKARHAPQSGDGRTLHAAAPSRGAKRRTTVGTLLGSDRELIIEHNNEEYRLRLTSNGKLILTK